MNTDKHGIAVVHHWLIQSKSQTQDAMLFSVMLKKKMKLYKDTLHI